MLELRNSIEEPGVLSPEFHPSTATWSGLNEFLSVLEGLYAVTLKLQAEDLTSGVFTKEWCSLKHTLRGKQTSLALKILRAMKKREESLFQNKLFLAGVFVDARYRILLSEEQVELAKAGLLEVTYKARHCSVRAFSVSDTADTPSENIIVGDITSTDNPASSASEENEFEKELDLLEQRKSPEHLSSSNTFNQVAQEMNNKYRKNGLRWKTKSRKCLEDHCKFRQATSNNY